MKSHTFLFTVDQTESQIVIVEDDKKVNLILDKPNKHLKKIVAIKELHPSTMTRAKNQGINIWMFDEVERIGAMKNHVEEPPQPDGNELIINLTRGCGCDIFKFFRFVHNLLHLGDDWSAKGDHQLIFTLLTF